MSVIVCFSVGEGYYMNIGKNMHRLRKAQGLTQKVAAEQLHLTVSNYNRFENEKLTMTVDILIEVANLYGVSLDELCGYEVNGENRVDNFSLAMTRLERMGVKTDVKKEDAIKKVGNKEIAYKRYVVTGNTVTIDVYGKKYQVNVSDIAKMVEVIDNNYDKMLVDLNKGLYHAAMLLALHDGDFNTKVPGRYRSKTYSSMVLRWAKKQERITPDVILDWLKEYFVVMSSLDRKFEWDKIVRILREEKIISDEDYNADERWQCPFVD